MQSSSAQNTTAAAAKEGEAKGDAEEPKVKNQKYTGPPKIITTDENGNFVEVTEEQPESPTQD